MPSSPNKKYVPYPTLVTFLFDSLEDAPASFSVSVPLFSSFAFDWAATDSTWMRSTIAVNKSAAYILRASIYVSTAVASRDTADVRNVVGKCTPRTIEKIGGTKIYTVDEVN